MSTVVVDVSELRSFDSDCIKDLTAFLEKRLEGTVTAAKKEVTLEFEEGKEASRSCLRLLLRKFLHREDLKLDFRVISGGENAFILKLANNKNFEYASLGTRPAGTGTAVYRNISVIRLNSWGIIPIAWAIVSFCGAPGEGGSGHR